MLVRRGAAGRSSAAPKSHLVVIKLPVYYFLKLRPILINRTELVFIKFEIAIN
jgi:hypothetical protein